MIQKELDSAIELIKMVIKGIEQTALTVGE